MARSRDPNRDKAHEIWIQHNGQITNREIANILNVDEKKIAVWKQRDKWNVVQQNSDNVVQQKNTTKKVQVPKIENDDLTDKQKLFCLYYIKYFNATKAYKKTYQCAYTTAMVEGHKHLRNPKIEKEIDRLKKELSDGILLDGKAVLQKYIDIAFADITDFVMFGRKEVPRRHIITGEPILNDEGEQEIDYYSYLDVMNGDEVDGSLITEIKQGKEGNISLKLADKMKALDFLSDYTDLLSVSDRKKLQEEKLKTEIAKNKAEIENMNSDEDDKPIEITIKRKGDRS